VKKEFTEKTKELQRKSTGFIAKHPIAAFIVVLVLLFLTIVASNYIQNQKDIEEIVETPALEVQVYEVGSLPYITAQGQVDKAGVVTVYAQSGGVVKQIHLKEGSPVEKGKWIVSLSTNYQGADAAAVSRQLSQRQYQNVLDTIETQKELISLQKEIAEKTDENADELREINSKSAKDTKGLIDLNNEIVDELDDLIDQNDALSDKMLKSQYQSALNTLRSSLRTLEYNIDGDKLPAELSGLSRDATLKQLEIQEQALDLNRDVSKLQLDLARIQESLMHPAAPFSGTIQEVHVNVGQLIQPGTAIATIAGDSGEFTATAYVPKDIAFNVSTLEPSEIEVSTGDVEVLPTHVSAEATRGQLYSILYDLPQEIFEAVANQEYVAIRIPLGYRDIFSQEGYVYVPIDSIRQTQTRSYVLTNNNGTAESREVVLGPLYGQFALVQDGLIQGDQVILDRNIISGDQVMVTEE
jgi:multidrug efflux pump subunit AcrA (membrane-fusion protein)